MVLKQGSSPIHLNEPAKTYHEIHFTMERVSKLHFGFHETVLIQTDTRKMLCHNIDMYDRPRNS